jgi:hypothetical protein
MRFSGNSFFAGLAAACALAASPALAQPAHGAQRAADGLLFEYGLVPAATTRR